MYRIDELLDKPALLDQLAEEATELAHAAMKCARILREENPTRATPKETTAKLLEEYSDVVLSARVLHLYPDEDSIDEKMERWFKAIIKHRDIQAALFRKELVL